MTFLAALQSLAAQGESATLELKRSTAELKRAGETAGTTMDAPDILDRLGLCIDGQATQAAQMLYETRFLPAYPQALLKLGRFRGAKITGDILDNKHEYLGEAGGTA